MRLNNKGFSLIEILAVVVILSIIGSIMFSTIGNIINDTNEKVNIKNEESLISATKMFINDHKYGIVFDANCSESVDNLKIDYINQSNNDGSYFYVSSSEIVDSKISGGLLYQFGYLKDDSLKDKKVEVIFDCNTKKFNFSSE